MTNAIAPSPSIGFGMSKSMVLSVRPRPAFQGALPMTTGAVSPAVACPARTDAVRSTSALQQS